MSTMERPMQNRNFGPGPDFHDNDQPDHMNEQRGNFRGAPPSMNGPRPRGPLIGGMRGPPPSNLHHRQNDLNKPGLLGMPSRGPTGPRMFKGPPNDIGPPPNDTGLHRNDLQSPPLQDMSVPPPIDMSRPPPMLGVKSEIPAHVRAGKRRFSDNERPMTNANRDGKGSANAGSKPVPSLFDINPFAEKIDGAVGKAPKMPENRPNRFKPPHMDNMHGDRFPPNDMGYSQGEENRIRPNLAVNRPAGSDIDGQGPSILGPGPNGPNFRPRGIADNSQFRPNLPMKNEPRFNVPPNSSSPRLDLNVPRLNFGNTGFNEQNQAFGIEDKMSKIRNDPLYTEEEKNDLIKKLKDSVPKKPPPPAPQPLNIVSLFSKDEEETIRKNLKLRREKSRDGNNDSSRKFRNNNFNSDFDRKPFKTNFDNDENWENSYGNSDPVDVDAEIARSNDLFQEHIALPADEQTEVEELMKKESEADNEENLPAFLMCPLCKDLLDDPVVLPCFHSLCRNKCIPRVMYDSQNVWCPQCVEMQVVKPGIDSLKAAVTFDKMILQHKQKREKLREEEAKATKEPAGEVGTTDSQDESQPKLDENPVEQGLGENQGTEETQIVKIAAYEAIDKVKDLTCQICHKLFSLPLKLSCGHAICKFPCAYRSVQYNSKFLCKLCEKPTWVSAISELPIDKVLVKKVMAIKGDRYLDFHAKQLRSLENEHTAEQYVGITALFDDDDVFHWRLTLLDKVQRQKEKIPSLLNIPLGATLPKMKRESNRPKTNKKKKKNTVDDEDEFNPDELFPCEDPPESDPSQLEYAPGDPMYDINALGNFSEPPPGYDPYSAAAQGVDPMAAQAPFQPPILDVKSMVPENAGADFDYIAPWNLFAQQTQNYYTTYYASLGGVPAEAQQQVKDYLEKCWSWYSAYFKLQTVKNDKADSALPTVEPASKDDASELATKVKKLKTAKNKKEKEKLITEFSSEVAAAVTQDEKQEALEIEELKILLLKKQLELKLKNAKSKSEARDLKKLKELVEEEEGKTEEDLDEEEKKKREKEAKEAREKELEELKEAARKKQLEREKQIEELEKKRKRTRQEELRKLEKARKRTKEKREREEREDRDDDDRYHDDGRAHDDEDRYRDGKRSKRDEFSQRDEYDNRYDEDYYGNQYRGMAPRGGYRGRGRARGGYRGRGRGFPPGDGAPYRGSYIPRGARGRGSRGRGGGWYDQGEYEEYDQPPPYVKRRRPSSRGSRSRSRDSRSRSRDSRSRSRSGSRSSQGSYEGSRGKGYPQQRPQRREPPPSVPPRTPDISVEDKNSTEPKFIKITNLPDDVTAKSLKSFIEAFGRVINCKIGKMQGEMMAVAQMQNMADAISCVREMHNLPYSGKILDVRYMGDKPMVKQVEVSLPDVYDRPKPNQPPKAKLAGKSATGATGESSERLAQRKLLVQNLPWGTTQHEVIDLVSHHAIVLKCRVATNPDIHNRGLYAEVLLESYFDVLKCINALHGTRYEGRLLEIKKVTI